MHKQEAFFNNVHVIFIKSNPLIENQWNIVYPVIQDLKKYMWVDLLVVCVTDHGNKRTFFKYWQGTSDLTSLVHQTQIHIDDDDKFLN